MHYLILQSVVGLLIGAAIGAVLGFVKFALVEKLYSSGGLIILAPSGWLNVGIVGAVLMGLAGGAIGLITGALRLHPYQAAIAAILIFGLIKGRALYSGMRSLTKNVRGYLHGDRLNGRTVFMDLMAVTLLLDFAIIGVLVAVTRTLIPGW